MSLDVPNSSSFHASLNSIDENKTIKEFNDFTFTKQQHPDLQSDDFLYEKRQSEPAIRFSFYNKLFDFEGRTQRLLPPPKDYRKYSLPLSMFSSQPECPISSLMSPSCKFAVDVPTWRSFNTCFTKSNHCDVKFKLTINDEDGQEIKNSSFETMSPADDYSDEHCLFNEENSMKRKNQFENNFIDNDDDSLNSEKICHKCGHAKLKIQK